MDLTGHIRTYVPIIVGWLIAEYAISLDETTASAIATGVVIAVYYAAVRALEAKWPQFGWLLGTPRAPDYPPRAGK